MDPATGWWVSTALRGQKLTTLHVLTTEPTGYFKRVGI